MEQVVYRQAVTFLAIYVRKVLERLSRNEPHIVRGMDDAELVHLALMHIEEDVVEKFRKLPRYRSDELDAR